MKRPKVKRTKDSAVAIVKALAETPNGAPSYYNELPLRDPGGQHICYEGYTQCLICYHNVKGLITRHTEDCAWLRARRLTRSKRRARG